MKMNSYADRLEIQSSLFKSDQEVLGEEAIQKILSGKIVLPQKAKVALLKYYSSDTSALKYYGYAYWRSEEYVKTQQEYIDTLWEKLGSSERVVEVAPMPSLLVPKEATIPLLREAAVRLQADLLLVFTISSDIYSKYHLFSKSEAKAFSTCEAVLLDVRTGIIPFSTVVTKEVLEYKTKDDIDLGETMKRAEKNAVLESLNTIAEELTVFLADVP
jgi:hypothetical protein